MDNYFVWLWVLMFALFVIAELLGPQLITIWFAFGSLAALGLAYSGMSLWAQLGGFFAVSIVLLIITLPISRKFRERNKKSQKTNVDVLIGEEGVITKAVTPFETGLVKVKGQIWTCKGLDDENIAEGTVVSVDRVEGVKLIVSARTAGLTEGGR